MSTPCSNSPRAFTAVSRCTVVQSPLSDPSPRTVSTRHNRRLNTAGLQLDLPRRGTAWADNAQHWEKIATKLRTGEMPPPGRPRPDAATSRAVAAGLERELDAAAAAKPHPGTRSGSPPEPCVSPPTPSAICWVSRSMGRALLSSDEADQEGFDNVASVLSVSPALLENYLTAARTLSRRAVGDPRCQPVIDTFKISKALVQDERIKRRAAVRFAGRRADSLFVSARRRVHHQSPAAAAGLWMTSSAWASGT